MQKNNFIFIFIGLVLVAGSLKADDFIQWQSSNIQLLRGGHYELGDSDRTIVTFEHANAWAQGDFFMFVDWIKPDDGESGYYAEFSPRFSLSKMIGKKVAWGMIKDFSLAVTIEKPESQDERALYGVGTSLDVAGFDFVHFNTYVRDNPDLSGTTHQFTFAWKSSFSLGAVDWVFEGFADFAGAEGDTAANSLIVPRLLFDAGQLWDMTDKDKLWLGVEYSSWYNKFGIKDVDESVVQLQAK